MSCPPSTISGVLISSGSVAAPVGPGVPAPTWVTAAEAPFAAVAGDIILAWAHILLQNTFAVIGGMGIRIVLDGVLQNPQDEMTGIDIGSGPSAMVTLVVAMTSRIIIPNTGNHIIQAQVINEGCPILQGGMQWMLYRAPPA